MEAQRLAPAPPRALRPKGPFQAPTPGKTGPQGAGRGLRAGAPPTSSSRTEDTALRGGEAGAGRPGPGEGSRAWRLLTPDPPSSPWRKAHPGTPGRGGSCPSGARRVLSPWRRRVSAAPPPRSASRYSPSPRGRGPAAQPGATGSFWSRRNSCRRRRRHLHLLPARPLPRRGRPAGSRPLSLF